MAMLVQYDAKIDLNKNQCTCYLVVPFLALNWLVLAFYMSVFEEELLRIEFCSTSSYECICITSLSSLDI